MPLLIREQVERRVVRVPEAGCWIWTGSTNAAGYGLLTLDRQRQAHRVSYELHMGPIPEGAHLDHLCRVRCCVNPAHLQPVTCKENIRRGLTGATARAAQLAKTHCKNGHERTAENTYLHKDGRKYCRVCVLEKQRAAYHNRKGNS